MRILIVKTSSLGDVIHTLPALTDAKAHFPEITFDWVIEPAFSEIPLFHPAVKKVIPVALRRWRKNIFQAIRNKEWQNFYHNLREEKYDYIIDAQGLIKSGFLTFLARGIKYGYDKYSASEPLACFAYNKKFSVKPHQHAITRIRQLFAKSLSYPLPDNTPDYNIQLTSTEHSSPLSRKAGEAIEKYCMLLHGTTREDKYWPEPHWKKLIEKMQVSNFSILLPWGNTEEKHRAERLAAGKPHVNVLPKLSLTELAILLRNSNINITVDSGLGHLSAALNTPTIALYGPTDPQLIGTIGQYQIHLKADKMEDITPEMVINKL